MKKATMKVRALWWINFIGVWLLAVPMVITPLKELMPPHWYGIVSSIAVVASFTVTQFISYAEKHPVPDDETQDAGA
jgi:membrane protein YdbS with pleckstrin-like domain